MTGMPGQNMRMLRGKSLDIHDIFCYPPTRGLWTALLDYTLGNFFYALVASLSLKGKAPLLWGLEGQQRSFWTVQLPRCFGGEIFILVLVTKHTVFLKIYLFFYKVCFAHL